MGLSPAKSNAQLGRGRGAGRGDRGTALTLVLAGTQQVDDVGVMAQFAQHLQLPGKVPMVILRSKLWKQIRDGRLSPTTRALPLLLR